jgi:GT2 family glycosyltransferase
MHSVSIIVPTCARAVALERLLTSIFATGYEQLEVVVVENRPPAPGTREVVETKFAHAQVRYVEEPRRGSSVARNAGLARAEGQIIAFADDDVVVDQDWIQMGVNAFAGAEDIACVTGRILPLSLKTSSQALFDELAAFDKGPALREFRLREARARDPLFPYAAGHMGSGANMFVRRKLAVGIGGFDPVLGLGTPSSGGEDLDLFIRIVRGGFAIVYDPRVIVFHDHPDSPSELRLHAFRYGLGLTAMLTKHLIRGPARLSLVKAIPDGLRHVVEPTSRKNLQKSRDYPRRLQMLEYLGMVLGPTAYVASLATHVGRELQGSFHQPTAVIESAPERTTAGTGTE